MAVYEGLRKRRSYYQLNKELPISEDAVRALIEETTELVPDAFNMKSARIVVALGEKQDELWDRIYEAFQGKVAREKIDGFKAAAGTVLYFYEKITFKAFPGEIPPSSGKFSFLAKQANRTPPITTLCGPPGPGSGATPQPHNPPAA